MRIAFLMSADMRADHTDERADSYEHDLEFGALQREGAARGITFEDKVWDEPATDWSRFDAVIVGTTWDYPQKREAFFETLTRIDQCSALFNPLELMRWNVDKIYLADLAAKGVPSIPVVWAKTANPAAINAAFDTLDCDEIVIKPRVGAGAWRQARLKRGAKMPPAEDLPPSVCLIQPFLPNVARYGEVSLLYYGGMFSHAARKIPDQGDYRVQSIYGAREEVHAPDAQEFAAAKATLAALPMAPLYARVDLVRDAQNQPVIMEVEMIEPYHYVEQGPDFAKALLDALLEKLDPNKPQSL